VRGDDPVAPGLAATVVLLREGEDGPEVLLIERPSSMAFAPGVHVFPGGRVDPEDGVTPGSAHDAAAAAHALGDNLGPHAALTVHRAAVRELREEAGIEIGGLDRLVPIAHWTTPRFMPRRFSTWFFVADLPADARPVFAPDEVAAHRWMTPPAALDGVATGEISMWVPTTSVLERLIETRATSAADVAARIRLERVQAPRIVHEDRVQVRFAFGAVGGLPGRAGETTLFGARRLVLVDPGDPSDEALDLIESVVERRQGSINAIVLTRTDPDHAAAAEAVARPLDIPVLVAPGGGRHVPYSTREVSEGEALPTDIDVHVRLGPPGSRRLEIVAD
jgi:8-oxo-dGTP pyrophosphatase MutT (NUDIX family)